MSYLRDPYYVYESNEGIEIYESGNHVCLQPDIFDALALMRICELMEEPARFVRVYELAQSYGNFGGDSLMKLIGGPTGIDILKRMITKMMPNQKDNYEICDKCGTFLRYK
jgi:hypothetical protein